MDITTIIGLIAGVAFIVYGVIAGSSIDALISFYDTPSLIIVVGGTFACYLVSAPLSDVVTLGKIIGQAFTNKTYDMAGGIRQINELANIARKEGILALEEVIGGIDDPFLVSGMNLVIDGTDADLVKGIMEAELGFIDARHKSAASQLETLAGFAPAFGMIGTLIGLILMLNKLDDPSALGPGMAVALVTTFYGSFLANLIFTPMATKLKTKNAQEILYKEMILEGILSIQAGENPRVIEQKLYTFLSRTEKTAAEAAAVPAGGSGE